MSVQTWQIVSGAVVGAALALLFYFIVSRFGTGSGDGIQFSKLGPKLTFVVALLILVISGTITVTGLVMYAPKADARVDEYFRSIRDRRVELVRLLDEVSQTQNTPAKWHFISFRARADELLAIQEDALNHRDVARLHEVTKMLVKHFDSLEALRHFSRPQLEIIQRVMMCQTEVTESQWRELSGQLSERELSVCTPVHPDQLSQPAESGPAPAPTP